MRGPKGIGQVRCSKIQFLRPKQSLVQLEARDLRQAIVAGQAGLHVLWNDRDEISEDDGKAKAKRKAWLFEELEKRVFRRHFGTG
jgi:hypothetical protein